MGEDVLLECWTGSNQHFVKIYCSLLCLKGWKCYKLGHFVWTLPVTSEGKKMLFYFHMLNNILSWVTSQLVYSHFLLEEDFKYNSTSHLQVILWIQNTNTSTNYAWLGKPPFSAALPWKHVNFLLHCSPLFMSNPHFCAFSFLVCFCVYTAKFIYFQNDAERLRQHPN